MNWPFLKGLHLSELLYVEAVRPILAAHFPNLSYSAGLVGPGSEVLGFDDPQSMDHDWGPRLMMFLDDVDYPVYHTQIDGVMRAELPHAIHGIPTNLAVARDDAPVGEPMAGTPVEHSVRVFGVRSYFRGALRFDPLVAIRAVNWITTPQQILLSLTRGRVFHDGLGQLGPIRATLGYYPHDVWLYLLAAQWKRIAQEVAFMGRCGQAGDDLGSRIVTARLVRDLMWLCFLMERQYAPYIKWFGTAFAQLECAGALTPLFVRAMSANSWQEREEYLAAAYEFVAERHNALGITAPLPVHVSQYYTRPFRVIMADQFAAAIVAAITSAEVLGLPAHLGSVDQFIDSTDAFNHLHSGELGLNMTSAEQA